MIWDISVCDAAPDEGARVSASFTVRAQPVWWEMEEKWERVCRKEFQSAGRSGGAAAAGAMPASLTITCYWIPSSSPPPQIAAGERASGRRSGHQKASGRLMLQENDIKLWIWSHLLRRSTGGYVWAQRYVGKEWGVSRSMRRWGLQTRWDTPRNP